MKTTLDLPDDLMRAVRIRAATEGRRLKDVTADLLRQGLSQTVAGGERSQRRVALPLIVCAHRARPEDEMTPERVAAILLDSETEDAGRRP